MLVLLGEVGGVEEYTVCNLLKEKRITKPVVAWCIGTCSDVFSTDVQVSSVLKNKSIHTVKIGSILSCFSKFTKILSTLVIPFVVWSCWCKCVRSSRNRTRKKSCIKRGWCESSC